MSIFELVERTFFPLTIALAAILMRVIVGVEVAYAASIGYIVLMHIVHQKTKSRQIWWELFTRSMRDLPLAAIAIMMAIDGFKVLGGGL